MYADQSKQNGKIGPKKDHPQDLHLNPKGGDVKIGNKLCLGRTCINEEELQALKNLKSGVIKGDLQVTGNANIGSAYIGSSKAHGAGWAEFSHKHRGAGAGDYSIMSDAAGHTLINSKGNANIQFKNKNNQHAYVNHHGHIHTNSSIHANSSINANGDIHTKGSYSSDNYMGIELKQTTWASNHTPAVFRESGLSPRNDKLYLTTHGGRTKSSYQWKFVKHK